MKRNGRLQRHKPIDRRSRPGRKRLAGRPRTCEHCGEEFKAVQEHRNYSRKYCSQGCAARARAEKVVSEYPSREEFERLYVEEGLSERQIARRYNRSRAWATTVRRHHRIPARRAERARRSPAASKKWGPTAKGEPACRRCGKEGYLHLHHAVPRSLSAKGRNDLRNGIPLCPSCHWAWHGGQPFSRELFTAEEWAFIETLIGPGWLARRYPRASGALAA